MSSNQPQFLDLTARHGRYDAIDPNSALKNSAEDKVIFIAGASQGIGQAIAVACAEADAKAVYKKAGNEGSLKKTRPDQRG